nr:hypothetical chloroplast RF12 [Elakatothrix viridis]
MNIEIVIQLASILFVVAAGPLVVILLVRAKDFFYIRRKNFQ